MIRTVQSQSKRGEKRQDPQKQDKREGLNKGRSASWELEGDKLKKSLEFKNKKKGEGKRVRMEDEMVKRQKRQDEEVDLMKMNEERPGMMKKGKSRVLVEDLSKSKSKEKQKFKSED